MPPDAVAVVGSQVITRQAFIEELARRAGASPGGFSDPKDKQAVLEELIRFEVLHQKALSAGYDKDPQVSAAYKRLLVARYQEHQLAQLGAPKVSPAEVTAYYQDHLARFGTPEQVRVALIELRVPRTAAPAKRAEVAAQAAAILAEAKTNAAADHSFGLLAQTHSEHQASRYRGGDVGWFTRGATNSSWPPEVLAAVFSLAQPGDLGPVVATPAAFYLVKLVEKQPARVRPLAEVRDGVEYLVTRELEQRRQDQLQAALRTGLEVRINQPLLDSLALPSKEVRPPGLPGARTSAPAAP